VSTSLADNIVKLTNAIGQGEAMADPQQGPSIGDLPLEVLLKIFDLSILTQVHPDIKSAQRGDGGAAQQRTALRGVSHLWNRTILDVPRYWTHITLDLRKIRMNEIDKLRAGYDWVQLCIRCSQDLQCHLRIVDPGMPPDGEFPPVSGPGWTPPDYCTIPGLSEFAESTKGKCAEMDVVSTASRVVLPGGSLESYAR
jgi:hypothetical protein